MRLRFAATAVAIMLTTLTGSVIAAPLIDGTYLLTEEFRCSQSDTPLTGRYTFDNSARTVSYDSCVIEQPSYFQCTVGQGTYSNNEKTLTMLSQKYHVFYDTTKGATSYITLLGSSRGCTITGTLVAAKRSK